MYRYMCMRRTSTSLRREAGGGMAAGGGMRSNVACVRRGEVTRCRVWGWHSGGHAGALKWHAWRARGVYQCPGGRAGGRAQGDSSERIRASERNRKNERPGHMSQRRLDFRTKAQTAQHKGFPAVAVARASRLIRQGTSTAHGRARLSTYTSGHPPMCLRPGPASTNQMSRWREDQ